MSDANERRVAELEEELRRLRAQASATEARLPAPPAIPTPQGTVNVDNQGRINGVAVGVNLGTIIYGRAPEEGERERK